MSHIFSHIHQEQERRTPVFPVYISESMPHLMPIPRPSPHETPGRSHSLPPGLNSVSSCSAVGELQSPPTPPPPSRRRQRSPGTAIPPRKRRRMRRPEHVSYSDAGGFEQGHREAQGRPQSPSPSFSGSYVYDDDDDDDQGDEGHGVESARGSVAEWSTHGPTSSGAAPASAPQPKPKRTRQLTTPHQSAVLHALLAQSRFPTTAMREEVGRQIGLSARRVQVWFQNQRQKARKSNKEAAVAAASSRETGPPQFGPYSNVPPGSAIAPGLTYGDTMQRTGLGPAGPSFSTFSPVAEQYVQARDPPRRASAPSFIVGPSTTPFRRSSGDDLTGPGVPGSSAAVEPLSQSSRLPPVSSALYTRSVTPEQPVRLAPGHSVTPPLPPIGRRGGQTPSAPAHYQPEHFERDLPARSLRLPPIQLGPHEDHRRLYDQEMDISQGQFDISRLPHLTRPSRTDPDTLPPLRSPVAPIVTSRGRSELPPSTMTSPRIPPPFTLEPDPLQRPTVSSSVRARVHSGPVSYTAPGSAPHRQFHESGDMSIVERRTLPAPTRTMRFDPVRNTEVAPQQPPRGHPRSSDEEN